jgi:hypothetical protein
LPNVLTGYKLQVVTKKISPLAVILNFYFIPTPFQLKWPRQLKYHTNRTFDSQNEMCCVHEDPPAPPEAGSTEEVEENSPRGWAEADNFSDFYVSPRQNRANPTYNRVSRHCLRKPVV